jgi:hypothetical protein
VVWQRGTGQARQVRSQGFLNGCDAAFEGRFDDDNRRNPRAGSRSRKRDRVTVTAPDRADGGIDRPIFVFGTGCCGTTLFFHLLGFHPDLAWFSNYGEHFCRQSWPPLLSRLRDVPGLERLVPLQARYVPRPAECYGILNELTGRLFTAQRRLAAGDATPDITERFRRRVRATLRLQGKSRFAHKHTGFARTRFLRAIFPGAIHPRVP